MPVIVIALAAVTERRSATIETSLATIFRPRNSKPSQIACEQCGRPRLGDNLPDETMLDAADKTNADEHAVIVDVVGESQLAERRAGREVGAEVGKGIVAKIEEKRLVPRIANEEALIVQATNLC